MIKVNDKYFEEYISEEELKLSVAKIADKIKADHTDMSELVVIGVLNGSIPFMNDVIFKLPNNITIDYVKVSSYGDNLESSGKVELLLDTKLDIAGKDVLVIDDIIDSGLTQSFLKDHFSKKNARTVKSCCLFYKNAKADYSGIEIDDDFIIGYGLDYAQKGRNINRILKLVK
ncbi:MAG: hypoxanthine phosphoribosyltransferase [Candidatus Delongbacteria bacterium]|jgi:hypoxanthine phosphoribosyltransferase|nr:hypoxanthine phosphoribosyltransferase [Candidatus Delongbacteria bacterium]